ncbi:MAG TPA: proline--tRNA ligase [Chloroflexi bacterium]|nr:proline--tRNA ligase [Chloroflexota bacterium]|tara:strand:- start:865 stop:2307 length:1443 start_codon:yes stop_codon:yes gene_type:complete
MSKNTLPSRSEDFNAWYNTLVVRADLADYGPARGTMIVKPYGWTLWENMQQALDKRFKATGHLNAGFPMFIPKSFIDRETSHVEGFSPELAVVTIGGGKQLEEPLIVRPTSETIIGHTYSKWIKSYRDLPLLINLWNSVVRWELRTKLFLRTLEFWWQEGHTAHATYDEAEQETLQMLEVYRDFARNEAAIDPFFGRKSDSEKFPGADVTYSIEAMMGDKKALQAGTSHNLGQNFAKAFDIQYLDKKNEMQYCWTTSWGLSTRFIGAMIMTHGDDYGLILPPRLAPFQVIIIPIYRDADQKASVLESVDNLNRLLIDNDIRVKIDDREELTPGHKFHYWELRGVPLRIEVGPKDVVNKSVVVARRDIVGKLGKQVVSTDSVVKSVSNLLVEIQEALLKRATNFRDSNTHEPDDYKHFQEIVSEGFALAWWCGDASCEIAIKNETKATSRCIPVSSSEGNKGTCIYCDKDAIEKAYFAKAY